MDQFSILSQQLTIQPPITAQIHQTGRIPKYKDTYYTRNRKTNSLEKQTSAGGNNALSNTGNDT